MDESSYYDDYNSSEWINGCHPYYFINITSDQVDFYTYDNGQIFVITILLPLLLVLGILGNSTFIFVVYRRQEMRTVTNWYLTNLAVADMLFLFSAIVDKIWAYSKSPVLGDNGPHGPVGCVLIYLVADLTYFSSLCFVTLVSFDRFMAVLRPHASKGRRGKKAVPVRLSLASWIVAFSFAACLITSRSKFAKYCLEWPREEAYNDYPIDMYVCRSKKLWMDAFANVLQTVPFFLTFALNVFLYVNIIRGLDRSIQNLGNHGISQDKNLTMRNQIARMLVVNGLVFFCCLFPFELMCLFQVIRHLGQTVFIPIEVEDLLFEISRVLAYVNSVANPLIYTLMSHRYRTNFLAAFNIDNCSRESAFQRGRRNQGDATTATDKSCRNLSNRCQTQTRLETI